jgi:hypothetical protein
MTWVEAIVTLVPYGATVAVSIYAIRNNTRLKELEIKDNERGRVFELQRVVTEKAIEVVVEASFRLGQQAIRFAKFVSEGRTECDPGLYEQMKSDLDFIERNKPFFPDAVREDMHGASSRLTNILRLFNDVDHKLRLQVFTEALPTVRKAKEATEQFLDQYNLFNIGQK